MIKRRHFVACLAALLSSGASAEALQERNMPMDIALELAQGAVKACAADSYNVSAAVVDRAGVLRALLRADNAGVHTPDAARRKAYTAVSARTPTSAMAKNIQDNPGAGQLVAIDDFLILAGGVPVKIGNETIGAIGVGGAPGGNLDEACALAAIKEVEGKLK
ncbi:hypothetical protein AU467_29230 [Mesorhizobium loti]|uniref:Heme-binding protein n=1 Tax=Rhizobium loti TaxID=381 RepID=A0A117N2K7_RHILI|nr:hypothetical protein AU467_29230 [Mesorhizobium loti]